MEIKDLDMEKIRKYVVWIIIIGIIITFRDTFIGLIATILSTFGITVGTLPPGFLFFMFAVCFFGFTLLLMMILQKKKLQRTKNPSDVVTKGFCDICNNPKSRNVLPMNYKEEGKDDATIYVCERCREEIMEIKENDKRKESKSN